MKIKAFLYWLLVAILLDSMFIIPMTIFIDSPLSLFLSIIWGTIVGIMCSPLWQRFVNIKTLKNVKFDLDLIATNMGAEPKSSIRSTEIIEESVKIINNKGTLEQEPSKLNDKTEPMIWIYFNYTFIGAKCKNKEFIIDKDEISIPDGTLVKCIYYVKKNIKENKENDNE